MRVAICTILLIYSFALSAQTVTVFQNAESKRYFNKKELEEFKENRIKTHQIVFPNQTISLSAELIEEIIRGDSLIKVFEWKSIKEGTTEKVLEYKDKQLPDYRFKNLENKPLRLSEFEGKPILIDFWFTNCRPCIAKFPELNELAEAYQDQVHFLAITFDTKYKVKKLLQKLPLNFIHLVNAKPFLDEIGQQFYPKIAVLDRSGTIVYMNESFESVNKEDLFKILDEALSQ